MNLIKRAWDELSVKEFDTLSEMGFPSISVDNGVVFMNESQTGYVAILDDGLFTGGSGVDEMVSQVKDLGYL